LPRHGYCRICEFFKKYPYKLNDKTFFEAKAKQGASLRKLELLLESYGCRSRKDLINKHLKECLGITREDRQIEKDLKHKGIRKVGQKISGFFIRSKLEELPKKCPHSFTTSFQSLHDGNIYTKCKDCGKILGSFDPHRKKTKKRNNLLILESLRK